MTDTETAPLLADHKELINQVESMAAWRAAKTLEHGDDERNLSSAHALSALADSLRAMPADHPALIAYRGQVRDSDPLVATEAESFVLGRYGFDHQQNCDAESFLTELTDAIAAMLGSEVVVRRNPVLLPDGVFERCVQQYVCEAERNGENPAWPCHDPHGDKLPNGRLKIELYNRRGTLAVYEWTGKRIVRKRTSV